MKVTDKINILHGDCLEVLKLISDKSIDAIITDPPYGTTVCKWDNIIPFDLMWEQLNRIIKPNGAIVLFGSQPFTSALIIEICSTFYIRFTAEANTIGMVFFAFISPFLALPFAGYMVESKFWNERIRMAFALALGYALGALISDLGNIKNELSPISKF